MFSFDEDAYLQRIELNEPVSADHDSLVKLHRQHARTVPFENFDVLLGRSIDLSIEKLWEKIVTKKRGGYCFETNAFFLAALRSFGYMARPLFARVHVSGTVGGRTHQINLVSVDGEDWLCDVGFGAKSLRIPFRFVLDQPQEQDSELYRLIEDEDFGYILQHREMMEWQNLYSFGLEKTFQSDLEMGNYYTSTHPDSFFTSEAVAAIQTEKGRKTLHNYTLRHLEGYEEDVTELVPGFSYLQAVKENFGIRLDKPFNAMNLAPPSKC